jgi:hypothetical protein
MRALIIGGAALLSACASAQVEQAAAPEALPSVNVFAVAHQDDWQLFMNPEAYRAMDEAHEKAVFVHLTAGDAGRGVTGEPVAYYLAREEGALRAVRFMANAQPETGMGVAMESAMVERAGHMVQRFAYANAAVYFLRLPDGNFEGPGYETTGWQSLHRLRIGAIAEIEAVDSSARYAGWDDLTATLGAIIASEMRAGEGLGLHFPEQDAALNPGDHSDHLHAALAMEAAAAHFPCARVARYDEYATNERPENVAGADLLVDVGTWAATASGLSDNGAPSTWDPVHNSWLGRSYSRVTPPSGSCPTPARG